MFSLLIQSLDDPRIPQPMAVLALAALQKHGIPLSLLSLSLAMEDAEEHLAVPAGRALAIDSIDGIA